MKYLPILEDAKANLPALKKKLVSLKKTNNRLLDTQFHAAHVKTFKGIDCLSCANCCKTTSPIFRKVDIDRISKSMGMKSGKFEDEFLRVDEDGDFVLKSSPCYFLGNDNKCSIYDVRPLACREYPHTDRKNMFQILDLTAKNLEICPAVAKIVTEMEGNVKKSTEC
jgi:Fe-S-cluster containining protein